MSMGKFQLKLIELAFYKDKGYFSGITFSLNILFTDEIWKCKTVPFVEYKMMDTANWTFANIL